MKVYIAIIGAVALLGAVAFAGSQAQPNLANLESKFTASASKACLFPAGGWTIVNCSNVAAATSAQLNDWSRYVVQCGDDSYFATGDEATDEADANDGYVPAGAWLELMTDASVRYVSCLNINVDSDCRYIECR